MRASQSHVCLNTQSIGSWSVHSICKCLCPSSVDRAISTSTSDPHLTSPLVLHSSKTITTVCGLLNHPQCTLAICYPLPVDTEGCTTMAGVLLSVSTRQMHSVVEKLTGLKGDKCEKHTTLQSFPKGGELLHVACIAWVLTLRSLLSCVEELGMQAEGWRDQVTYIVSCIGVACRRCIYCRIWRSGQSVTCQRSLQKPST
jgi:hypothetical protein